MRLLTIAGTALLGCSVVHGQTADRSAAPAAAPTAAPPAHTSYAVQNGELIVAPGLRVPNGNVPWALDVIDGRQVLVPVHHAALQADGVALKIEGGASSRTPLRSSSPSFFVHTSDRTENTGDSGRGVPTGWALERSTVDGDTRHVERVKFTDVHAGTVCTPPVLCASAESLPDGWIRIAPKQPLDAGEYVLIPVKRAGAESAVGYDFSVGAQAAPAKDAVTPGQNLDAIHHKKKH